MDKSKAGDIEITPEMIEAGKYELSSYSPGWCTEDEVVRDVFKAMVLAQEPKNT